MAERGTICETDLGEAAMLFAVLHDAKTFTPRHLKAFLQVGAADVEEEQANEILLALVAKGFLREVGPGVYALVDMGTGGAPMEQPLWAGDAQA